jgi:hypothetical protein
MRKDNKTLNQRVKMDVKKHDKKAIKEGTEN